MRREIIILCLVLISTGYGSAAAQETSTATTSVPATEARVPLAGQAIAFDADGRAALAGRLRTTGLSGTPDAPARNARLVIENRSPTFYTYVSGWATFYDAEGVRCGEGLFKMEALAPNESAEVETPGLRLSCTPLTWRIVANNLLTRTTDVAKPDDTRQPSSPVRMDSSRISISTVPPLVININGTALPLQLGNPVEITVGAERMRIVVNAAP